MSLTDILRTSRDALNAQQYGLSVAGQNVANVNTPGYARRVAMLETRAFGGQSFGTVHVAGLKQAIDVFTERRWFAGTGLSSAADQRNMDLATVEALFTDSQGSGIAEALDGFFGSLSALTANPTDPTARRNVLERAATFASRMEQTGSALAQFQLDELRKAETVAAQINEKAARIAEVNGLIGNAEAQGHDGADLKDQRTQLILGLSELVDTHTFTDGAGQLVVQASGTTLIEGSVARSLSVTTAADGTLKILASRTGGSPSEVTRHLSGGMLAGIRDARDFDARAAIDRLDQLAFDVATAVNTQHAAGFGLDGVSGRNLFAVSGTVAGAARSLAVDAQVAGQPDRIAASSTAAGLQGDSTNALLLSRLADTAFATGGTRTGSQAYSDIVGEIGLRKQNAGIDSVTREGMLAQVKAMRESQSGVSLDEEMVSLTQYQRAYQAASRVLTTADELLAELINMVGR